MSLANLTLKGMERYGAIELRIHADRSVARGFLAANLLLGSLFLFYFIFPKAKPERSLVGPIRLLGVLDPPPALKKDVIIPAGFVTPPPFDATKPVFGIPVPVPNAVAPNMYLPDLNLPIVPPGTSGVIGGQPGTAPIVSIPVKSEPIALPVTDDPDVFVAADKEPVPIESIESLVVYPEVAKRAGLEGKVIISAFIDIDGKVLRTRVEMADYDVFKQAAIDAIMKARFTPALVGKEPIRLWVTIPISFKLTQR